MIRPVLTELALFLAPFIVYAIFLWATQAGVLHPDAWTLPRIAWLVIVALVLMMSGSLAFRRERDWSLGHRRLSSELIAGDCKNVGCRGESTRGGKRASGPQSILWM